MTILDEIFTHKLGEIAAHKKALPLTQMRRQAEQAIPALDFVANLRSKRSPQVPALIAEVKHASPSKGILVQDFQPLELSQSYQKNGAAAISVLTDKKYFQGSLEHLSAIRKNNPGMPLLRKDFICDDYQVYQARAAGADAILLIVAYLAHEQSVRGKL